MGQCQVCKGTDTVLNEEISSQLIQDATYNKKSKKLLLIGTKRSGKSTLFKQLKQIHGDGLSSYNHEKQYIKFI